MSKAVCKEVMAEVLEGKGYNATQPKLDKLWEMYENHQTWEETEDGTDYVMVTGTSYADIIEYVNTSPDVKTVFGK